MSATAEIWRRYRACNSCEEKFEHVLHVFHFNSRLQDCHREIKGLEGRIKESFDEVTDEQVIQKLFDQYWSIYNRVKTNLRPVTQTQTVLYKHVLSAFRNFYSEKKNLLASYERNVCSTSEDDRPISSALYMFLTNQNTAQNPDGTERAEVFV